MPHKYQCTVPRRRLLLEIVDYQPTSPSLNERYIQMLREDLAAILLPSALEVVDLLELPLDPVVAVGAQPAGKPPVGLLTWPG